MFLTVKLTELPQDRKCSGGKKFFKVRENWHFEEKSVKIELIRPLI